MHLCFISQPIGNLYSESLSALWNSPKAIAKRRDMISGRYLASGCSRQYCGWREGKSSPPRSIHPGRQEWRELVRIQPSQQSELEPSGTLALVRRLVAEERRKGSELDVYKRSLESQLKSGQRHIDHLETKVRQLESLLEAGHKSIDHLETRTEKVLTDCCNFEAGSTRYLARWLARAARKASKILRTFRHRPADANETAVVGRSSRTAAGLQSGPLPKWRTPPAPLPPTARNARPN